MALPPTADSGRIVCQNALWKGVDERSALPGGLQAKKTLTATFATFATALANAVLPLLAAGAEEPLSVAESRLPSPRTVFTACALLARCAATPGSAIQVMLLSTTPACSSLTAVVSCSMGVPARRTEDSAAAQDELEKGRAALALACACDADALMDEQPGTAAADTLRKAEAAAHAMLLSIATLPDIQIILLAPPLAEDAALPPKSNDSSVAGGGGGDGGGGDWGPLLLARIFFRFVSVKPFAQEEQERSEEHDWQPGRQATQVPSSEATLGFMMDCRTKGDASASASEVRLSAAPSSVRSGVSSCVMDSWKWPEVHVAAARKEAEQHSRAQRSGQLRREVDSRVATIGKELLNRSKGERASCWSSRQRGPPRQQVRSPQPPPSPTAT